MVNNEEKTDSAWALMEEVLYAGERVERRTFHVIFSNEGPEGVALLIQQLALNVSEELKFPFGLAKPHAMTVPGKPQAEFHSFGSMAHVPYRLAVWVRALRKTEKEVRDLLAEKLATVRTLISGEKKETPDADG